MQKTKRCLLFWISLAVGLCCCCVLLVRRLASENADRQVAAAISYEHVLLLSETGGQSVDTWLRELSEAGVGYLIGTDENEAAAKAAAAGAGMAFARAGDTAGPGDAFLLPETDPSLLERDPVRPYEAPGGDASVPLVLVEDRTRTGVIMPESFVPDAWDGPVVKALYLYAEYRQNYLAGGEVSNTENILFLATTDRGVRLVILTPLTPYRYDEGDIVAEPGAYAAVLTGLAGRVEARGLHFGGEFSCADAPRLSRALLAGACLLPAAMAVLFLCLLLPSVMKPLWEWLILALGLLAAAGGAFVAPELLQTLVAFGTAVLSACYAGLWLGYLAGGGARPVRRRIPPAPRYLLALAGLTLCAAAGGLCVSALLADRAYMLGFVVFTGVKLAQLLPVLFAAAALFVALFRRNPRRARGKAPVALIVFMFVCVLAALALLILRSGDNMISVSAWELRARNFLERTLYARPRTKEFLMAFPALALFVAACERGLPVLSLPLGILSSVGAVSVVNTFCHIYTPLRVSLGRSLIGCGLGLVIGLIAMPVFTLLLGKPAENAE